MRKEKERVRVYVFRGPGGAAFMLDTVVTAALLAAVMAVYGGGGIKQTAGLSAAFGGCAVYRCGLLKGGEYHLGIWGQRKASKFRQSFRNAGMEVEIIKSRPPGRLVWRQTK
ncbi:hypothetical protein SAMN02745126_05054 [Enhydrobacter aerosaccus]|uniref:Uncharacterized protein n=1 Tax=Enhydrobacter aerosaccus TaxID=225324 RepID=A0A1T4SS05_9HYPH|nr:hypothetical protein [Enhydrobacter aerosaccus]SKA30936.1 hypothetical protein SAMN02745126_05054 [Enhydrobacter aerosaccus]